MEPLLSVRDVASLLSIHHKKVQRLARTGVIPCLKIGAVYRFRAATLEAWIGKCEGLSGGTKTGTS
jgi:excisionase family DNA binding protein